MPSFFGSIPGRLLLFLFSWALILHMLGGIRHLIWDTGTGLDKKSIEISPGARCSARSR